jgi:hypothetical protein
MAYACAYRNKWHQVKERLTEKQVNPEKNRCKEIKFKRCVKIIPVID